MMELKNPASFSKLSDSDIKDTHTFELMLSLEITSLTNYIVILGQLGSSNKFKLFIVFTYSFLLSHLFLKSS